VQLYFLFSIVAFWYLPYNVARATFPTEEEKQQPSTECKVDSSSVVGEKFVLKDALEIF
jgi:hypothetical protein